MDRGKGVSRLPQNHQSLDTKKRHIAILGSTGSIGKQALEVIAAYPEVFAAELLTASTNSDLLIEQARQFRPNMVVIVDELEYGKVRDALDPLGIKVFTGAASLEQVVQFDEVDIVLTAIVGFAGLHSTLKAIEAGKTIALANKETLVVAGHLITSLAREKGVNIYPVDSEHSAIFQCLAGEFHNPVEKIFLTASGGPFRGMSIEDLRQITPAQALRHPNWNMGAKITIDSATLMNKGLEVIEARWLFGLVPEKIEVIVHPQSIIHSMVQFRDGSIKAQLGLPDMRLPILYALAYPQRLPTNYPRFDIADYPSLTFEKPDTDTFRNLALAYEALRKGGNLPCVLNAANEVAVQSFLERKIPFLSIPELVEKAMEYIPFVSEPVLTDLENTDRETRSWVSEQVANDH